MKKAIVFAGGGSKGAYEYGVWKALRELGEEYDMAVGTSIGSINAGFYVQGDFDAAGELWTEMTLDTVMRNGLNLEKSFNTIYEQRENLIPFLKTYFKDGAGADITPFIACLEKYSSEEKFFASQLDYALVTVKAQNMMPVEVMKKDIQPGYYTRWINASCACFPAFPRCEIDGQFYLDGGYYDNLPIATAFRMGADRVTAVDLKPEATHPGYEKHPAVTYLKPSRDLGSFLCFEREVLDKLILLGYNDTMRSFGKLTGRSFYIADTEEAKKSRAGLAGRFLRKLTMAEVNYENSKRSIRTRAMRSSPFLQLLAAEYEPGVTEDELLTAGCELALRRINADDDRVYTMDQIMDELRSAYHEIRELSQFDLSAAAAAADKIGREKRLLSDLKKSAPDEEDHIVAILMSVLFDS